jgi:hypothetical protein
VKKEELKKRASLVDDRAVNLFKRYPMVGAAVFIAGMIVGLILGWRLL